MKFLNFWKPFVWLTLICYGLFVPAQDLPAKPLLNIPHIDKMVHFVLFFGLCLLMFRPLKKVHKKYLIIAPLTSILLAGLLELVQHYISITRSSNLYDFLANATGIIVSLLFYNLFVSGKKWEILF